MQRADRSSPSEESRARLFARRTGFPESRLTPIMNPPPTLTWRAAALFAVSIAGAAGPARTAEPPPPRRSILGLEQEDHGRPSYIEFMSGLRQTLAARLPGVTDIYAENLDLARFCERWPFVRWRNGTQLGSMKP